MEITGEKAAPKASEPPRERRPPPPPPPPPPRRSSPPPLPPSITDLGSDPDRTNVNVDTNAPEPRAEIIVKSKHLPSESIEPGDSPTRPMSMNELAAAERDFARREKLAPGVVPAALSDDETTPTPKGSPKAEAFAAHDDPTRTPVERPSQPRPPPPRSAPPPLPMTLLEGVEDTTPSGPPPGVARNTEPPVPPV